MLRCGPCVLGIGVFKKTFPIKCNYNYLINYLLVAVMASFHWLITTRFQHKRIQYQVVKLKKYSEIQIQFTIS